MKRIIVAAAVIAVAAAFGQTEEAILEYAASGKEEAESGRISYGEYYRQLHRRIALTPSEVYSWKAENLRVIGQRIDFYEAAEAGKITLEKAHRLVAEQQAEWEAAGKAQSDRTEQARERAIQQHSERLQQQQAQQEAQRRAIALQLLQGGAFRPSPGYQVPLYQMPQPTRCTSYQIGNTTRTQCN